MPSFIAYAVLASIVLLPLTLQRANQPIQALFDIPKSAAMRRFYIATLAGQVLCSLSWLIAEPRIIDTPIINWATLVFLVYLWTRAIILMREVPTTPPSSSL